MAQINDDEPTLLLAKCQDIKDKMILLNEGGVHPKLDMKGNGKSGDSSVWYLDNGVSNHMTSQRLKFKDLDEGVIGEVKFGDGSTVKIQGKGSVHFTTDDGKDCVLQEVYFRVNGTLCTSSFHLVRFVYLCFDILQVVYLY